MNTFAAVTKKNDHLKMKQLKAKVTIARKRERMFNRIFGIVLPLAGTALIAMATTGCIKRNNFIKQTQTTEAVITDFIISAKNDARQAIVSYSVNGHTYTKAIKEYTPEMSRGDLITINFMPDSPGKPRYIRKSAWTELLTAITGVIIIGLGVTATYLQRKARRKRMRLMETGKRIEAVITDIKQDENQSMKGMHPIIISCRYISPEGRLYLFNSAPAWHRSYEINLRTKIPVYVDSDNPSHYYVDVESVTD